MIDIVDQKTRSRIMASVPRYDTSPELVVRSALHRLGFRFRTSDQSLPGSPDIKLSRYRAVIFVHGCFWHRHDGCRYTTTPSTNRARWMAKFAQNVARDRAKIHELQKLGWRVMVVWACTLRRGSPGIDQAIKQIAEWIHSDAMMGMVPLTPSHSR